MSMLLFCLFLFGGESFTPEILTDQTISASYRYRVLLAEQEVGEQLERHWQLDRQKAIEVVLTMSVKRNGGILSTRERQVFLEATDGSPRYFLSEKQLSDSKSNHSGYFSKGVLAGRRVSAKGTSSYTSDMSGEDFYFPTQIASLLASSGLVPGMKLAKKLFLPDYEKPVHVIMEIGDIVTLGEPEGSYHHVTARFDIEPALRAHYWVDKTGFLIKASYPDVGLSLIYQPMGKNVQPTAPRSINSTFTITPTGKAPLSNRLRAMTLRVKNRSGGSPILQANAHQTLVDARQNSVTVQLARGSSCSGEEIERANFLGESQFFELDAELKKLALKIAGADESPKQQALAITRWVYANLEKGSAIQTGMAPVREILANKHGDCSEHTVLTVALCRALGIPTRAAFGLVYSNTRFMGHMWPEMLLDHWTGLDPTLGRESIDAAYLKIGDSNLSEGMARQGRLIGQIAVWEIEILNFQL